MINKKSASAEISNDLNKIEQLVANDPKKEQEATAYLTNIMQNLKHLITSNLSIQAPTGSTVQPVNQKPVSKVAEELAANNPVGIDLVIKELNNQIAQICNTVPDCDPIILNIKQQIKKLQIHFKQEYQRGISDSEKATQKYFSDVASSIEPLIKKLGTNKTIQSDVKEKLEGMFSRAVLRNMQLSREDIVNFLQEAEKGHIINMTELVKHDEGNIQDFVNKKYLKQFNLFKDALFGYVPGGTGANMGPGEVALSLLGNPTAKAEVGDLRIGNSMYEIKGNKPNRGGGRMNGKQVLKPTSGMKYIRDFFRGAFAQETVYKNAMGKTVSKYNWNDKGIKQLNDDLYYLVPNASQRERVLKKFLFGLWSHMITNYQEIKNFKEIIESSVSRGFIDPEMAKHNVIKLLYESYRLSDGEGKNKELNILALNASTLNYKIIRNVNDFQNLRVKGGINWNDANSSTSPQTYVD
jgi:hypothetical protein